MNIPNIPFQPFPKMARLNREIIISEKIDGTNSTVYVDDEGGVFAGSRPRWITPEDDNYRFAAWVKEHEDELRGLGPGMHRGEWWGQGIQRKYGLKEKRWSLFNTIRWCRHDQEPQQIPMADPRIVKMQDRLPACCHLVPVLYRGIFKTEACWEALERLELKGSLAAPDYRFPEGIVVFHVASNTAYKATLEKDDEPKGNWK